MVEKDSVKKHVNSGPHLEAKELRVRSKMGAEIYIDKVVNETPIRKGLKKMCERDHK